MNSLKKVLKLNSVSYVTAFLAGFIIIISKVAPVVALDVEFAVGFLMVAFLLLCVVNPPVAIVLILTSHYLIGQVSIAYPNTISLLTVLTVTLALGLFLARWGRDELVALRHFGRAQIVGICLILLSIFLGFVKAQLMEDRNGLPWPSSESALSIFSVGLRNQNRLLHYQFIAHWVGMIVLGVLGCMGMKEFRIFILSFSFFYIVEVFALPVEFFPIFFTKIYHLCEPVGLSLGNVNRSMIGYMAAIAAVISLVCAQGMVMPKWARWMLSGWSVLASVIVLLAGSKGPVLGWIVGVVVVLTFAERAIRRVTIVAIMLIMLVPILLGELGAPILPCGTIKQYTCSSYSYPARLEGLERVFEAPERRGSSGTILNLLFGSGLGSSTRFLDSQTGLSENEAGSLNLFVDLYLELGLIGLSLFLAGIGIIFQQFFRCILAWQTIEQRALLGAASGIFAVLLIKLLIAADTPTEDFFALMIGVSIGSSLVMPKSEDSNSTEYRP